VNEIAFQKMDERLLNFLKRKSALSDSNIISLTHEQIANELGTARVVVSRLLKQLEELNVVKLSRNRIEIIA
jgi:CRP/FNR family transcriptional regulator